MNIETEAWDNGNLVVNKKYAELLKHNNITTADALWSIQSDPVKNVLKERTSDRVFLNAVNNGDKVETYIKRYSPVPMKERLKSLVAFKKTIYDAYDEWNSILAFHHHNLLTMEPIAVGQLNGKTCNLTLGIQHYTRASELFEQFNGDDHQLKRDLIGGVASLIGRMHAANMAHQDFYLVHLFVTGQHHENIYIIDLQRVVRAKTLQIRWKIKDLAQLYFSSRPYISSADVLFFWKVYTNIVDPKLYRNKKMVGAVLKKAARIKRHDDKRAARRQAAQAAGRK